MNLKSYFNDWPLQDKVAELKVTLLRSEMASEATHFVDPSADVNADVRIDELGLQCPVQPTPTSRHLSSDKQRQVQSNSRASELSGCLFDCPVCHESCGDIVEFVLHLDDQICVGERWPDRGPDKVSPEQTSNGTVVDVVVAGQTEVMTPIDVCPTYPQLTDPNRTLAATAEKPTQTRWKRSSDDEQQCHIQLIQDGGHTRLTCQDTGHIQLVQDDHHTHLPGQNGHKRLRQNSDDVGKQLSQDDEDDDDGGGSSRRLPQDDDDDQELLQDATQDQQDSRASLLLRKSPTKSHNSCTEGDFKDVGPDAQASGGHAQDEIRPIFRPAARNEAVAAGETISAVEDAEEAVSRALTRAAAAEAPESSDKTRVVEAKKRRSSRLQTKRPGSTLSCSPRRRVNQSRAVKPLTNADCTSAEVTTLAVKQQTDTRRMNEVENTAAVGLFSWLRYSCLICNKRFYSDVRLSVHMQGTHEHW